MLDLQLRNAQNAPEGSVETVKSLESAYGFLPNLIGTLANAPAAVNGYAQVAGAFASSSLSKFEQQVVLLTTSVENECHYCVAAHTAVSKMIGAPDEAIEALRSGASLEDPRLEALRAFTLAVVRDRGWVGEEALGAFLDAGFTKEQVLEVVTGVAQKTISNYVNHLAATPLDENFAPFAWTPERERPTATV